MDSSRKAVEAYWRSRMIDSVTLDEDKVAPVYKLEEVCDLLRTSHVSIVKEVSDYVLKRLDHKSPIVKQKALRLIKFAVAESGASFQKEMQRHSGVIRQLFHYKGHPDPLKGDALNKAVRETAREAITALFADANNESKAAVAKSTENIQKRIEGFGNTKYEMPSEEKKSFLSEVVGIGLSTIAAGNYIRKNDNVGSYRRPNLQSSLTTETSSRDGYERNDYNSESYTSSRNTDKGTWGHDLRTVVENAVNNEDIGSSHTSPKSTEEKLLETIVTSGGVRLQPTRDAIQVFLTQAVKLDSVVMSRALDMKLQSPLWQVRLKACCILEAILRKKEDEHLSVLSLLDREQSSIPGICEDSSNTKPTQSPPVQMPDLIDTGDINGFMAKTPEQNQVTRNIPNFASSASLIDDLFGDASLIGETKNDDDPFADVSFHVSEEKTNDIFAGLTVDDKAPETEQKVDQGAGLLDLFSSSDSLIHESQINSNGKNVDDLMAGLSLNGTTQEKSHSSGEGGFVTDTYFPMAPAQYNMNMPANTMFNQAFATQQMNYGAMGAFLAQQQLLFQNLGAMNNVYGLHGTGNAVNGSSPFPDIFQPLNAPVQNHAATVNDLKKEDSKAFDFISDHVSATRNSKRVM